MSENPTVLVFDSGVGGLSIFHEIRALLPAVNIIYACDNQHYPYGNKEESSLTQHIATVLTRLSELYLFDLIVLACNSASTIALPVLRSRLQQPVVGVVPAIKPAAQLSNSKVIGLLATEGTVARQYTRDLIRDFAPDCKVVLLGSQSLVDMAERKLRHKAVDRSELRSVLDQLFDQPAASSLDTVILGCTHFPLLRDELEAVSPRKVQWLDSGAAIARRVKELINHKIVDHNAKPRLSAVFTEYCEQHRQIYPYLKEIGINSIDIIELQEPVTD
jgi:glutamate racemase